MAVKNHSRTVRLSDDMIDLIDRQVGDTFTQRFESLVTRCVWELDEARSELRDVQAQIDKKRLEFGELQKQISFYRLRLNQIGQAIDELMKA